MLYVDPTFDHFDYFLAIKDHFWPKLVTSTNRNVGPGTRAPSGRLFSWRFHELPLNQRVPKMGGSMLIQWQLMKPSGKKVIDYPHKKIEIMDQHRRTFHPLLGAGSPIQGPPDILVSTDSGLYRLPIPIPGTFVSVYSDLGETVLGASMTL